MKILIIEDEKLTAKDLAKTLVAIDSEIEIVKMIHSVEEAIDFFKTKPDIDLIFSDIELGDGLSFEIFEKLKITTPIIFCTAYNQYALEAFKTVGIDYILKPFSKQSIENAILKYQNLREKLSNPNEDYSKLLEILKQKINPQTQSIIIHQGDKIIPLNTKDIALFFIEDDLVFAYTFDGKKSNISQSMDNLEKQFPIDFFRANRQFLVNRKAVKDASHYFSRKILINLNILFTEQIIVGKLKTTAFSNWLTSN
jgi:two-component system, LytTR family, response regulator LytT